MKIGIIQGRLSPPTEGFQECPTDWKREFELLDQLGLNHIEWIVTADSFAHNPVLYSNVKEFSDRISSICADNLVDERFYMEKFLNYNLVPLCKAAVKNEISSITIPLLEDSSAIDDYKRAQFLKNILRISDDFPDLNFYFEAELHWDKLLEIVNSSDRFFITYDTGNLTSCGFDHGEYIANTIDKIKNVHLKDRTFDARTVEPTTGDTDFKLILDKFSSLGYNGIYTLQTARGEEGYEQETISKHKQIFERF